MSAHGIDARRAAAIAADALLRRGLVLRRVAEREQVGEQRVGDAVERRRCPVGLAHVGQDRVAHLVRRNRATRSVSGRSASVS